MQTITLQIENSIFDKFSWLLKHFSKNEIKIVNDIDLKKLSHDDFDFISENKLAEMKESTQNYKSGNQDDFEEYKV